jgi:hypothetical protein
MEQSYSLTEFFEIYALERVGQTRDGKNFYAFVPVNTGSEEFINYERAQQWLREHAPQGIKFSIQSIHRAVPV